MDDWNFIQIERDELKVADERTGLSKLEVPGKTFGQAKTGETMVYLAMIRLMLLALTH